MRCRLTFTGALCLALGLGLLLAAEAGAEPQDERFTWHPSVTITGVADDQPHLEESSPARVGAWLVPNVELGYRGDAFVLGADLGADLRRYLDDDSLAEEFWRVSGWGEVGIVPGLTLRMSDRFEPTPEWIAAPADATSNLIQTNQLRSELRYWMELPGKRELLATVGGGYLTGERFTAVLLRDNGQVAVRNHFRPDRVEATGTLEFQNPLGGDGRTSAYVRSQIRYRSFDASSVASHGEVGILAGLRTRRFRNVELDVAAGWGVISFDNRDPVQRFLGEGRMRVRLPNDWIWRVSAANRFVADVSGNNFVETTGRTGVERYFGESTSVSAAVFISRLENDAWDTDSNLFGGAEFRVQQRISRRTQLALTYRYWRNAGDFSADDFDQNRLALELTYRH